MSLPTWTKMPVIGATNIAGLLIAGGHYRNGVLLAPVTAKIIADLVMDGHTGFACEAFSPERFARDAT